MSGLDDERPIYTKWKDQQVKESKPQNAGAPILAPSFKDASSLDRQDLPGAVVRASQLLTQAWIGLFRIGLDKKESDRYVEYFGASTTVGSAPSRTW